MFKLLKGIDTAAPWKRLQIRSSAVVVESSALLFSAPSSLVSLVREIVINAVSHGHQHDWDEQLLEQWRVLLSTGTAGRLGGLLGRGGRSVEAANLVALELFVGLGRVSNVFISLGGVLTALVLREGEA